MQFRTEIGPLRGGFAISQSEPILMLGSCFTDEIGSRLGADGFEVLANPLGPIYNPVTLARTLARAMKRQSVEARELVDGPRGKHCLDYATRFSGPSASVLADVNSCIAAVSDMLEKSPIVIITLGSAYVYSYSGRIIGNCHKFPASDFERRLLNVDEISGVMSPVLGELLSRGCRVILTVSPIRHLADGLHGNTLGKATLHLAVNQLCESYPSIDYFPSYEILIDDLRDYRFYAPDMKHPSPTAVDYIYEIFMDTYMTPEVRRNALEARKAYKRSMHRQIL